MIFCNIPLTFLEPDCSALHQLALHVYQKSSLQNMLARTKGRRTKMLIEQCHFVFSLFDFTGYAQRNYFTLEKRQAVLYL